MIKKFKGMASKLVPFFICFFILFGVVYLVVISDHRLVSEVFLIPYKKKALLAIVDVRI